MERVAYFARSVGHRPHDPRPGVHHRGELGGGDASKDTDEELSIKGLLDSGLAQDGKRKLGFAAVQIGTMRRCRSMHVRGKQQ